jgi:hypothetical protein
MTSDVPTVARQRLLSLQGRLHDAEDDHDAAVRAARCGVTRQALQADLALWRAAGSAVVALAERLRAACLTSAFCDARPDVGMAAIRLIESVDDQIDLPAWRVIAAQVRLEAARSAS